LEESIVLVVELRGVALEERVARLERQVSRNSGNSSMPPSSDDLPGRGRPAPRRGKRSGRERGKQSGAQGSALSWVDSADEYVPHRPQGWCGCGADLAGARDVGVERSHQVHDLPQVRIRVSQHDVYRVRCACGAEHVGVLPGQVSRAPATYGPNLKSLVVYLLTYQHAPVQRCVQLIADLTGGTGRSDGFVHGMLSRSAAAVREVIAVIKR
jgi:transposase